MKEAEEGKGMPGAIQNQIRVVHGEEKGCMWWGKCTLGIGSLAFVGVE